MQENVSKNIAIGSIVEMPVDADICVFKAQNSTWATQNYVRPISRSYVQFHFCIKGEATMHFNQGHYMLPLGEEQSFLLYNTQNKLSYDLELAPASWVITLIVGIKKFHELFSEEAKVIPYLEQTGAEKKYYAQERITPAQAVVLSQILNLNVHASVAPLYLKAKVYELIALYFNRSSEVNVAQCPYLADEENVRKIKLAKEIVLERMMEPPTLNELSKEIGLPLKKLKEGFKQVYGVTVYGFLFDHKMEQARKLLETERYNVNEIALKLGYSTGSHFISAFKKKFGTTPKKYITAVRHA